MREYYYVLAKVEAKVSEPYQKVSETVGLMITVHPVQWALGLNYTPNKDVSFSVTPLFFSQISGDVYGQAVVASSPYIVFGTILGLEITN